MRLYRCVWASQVAHETPRELYGGVVSESGGFFEVFLKFVVTRFEARGLRLAHESPGGSRMEVANPP